MITNNNTVRLIDFGLSKASKSNKNLTTVAGTPYYMAPEIVKRETYNDKVDVWAVGVVAHVLLTGSAPFVGRTKEKIKAQILNAK